MTLHENIKVFLDRVKELEKYDDNDSDGYKKEFKVDAVVYCMVIHGVFMPLKMSTVN